MVPMTTMQKVKLAIAVGKKILAAKDAHDTKKAMESHAYLKALENQEDATTMAPRHLLALTYLAGSSTVAKMRNELKTNDIKLLVCDPGTELVRAFLLVTKENGERFAAVPLSLADLETFAYQVTKLHREIAAGLTSEVRSENHDEKQ